MTEKPLTQKTEQSKRDQLAESWSRMIHCIAHDLTTPLVSAHMSGKTCKKMLVSLIEVYKLAVEHNLPITSKINESRLQDAEAYLIPAITDNMQNIMSFLNLLHPYNHQLLSTTEEAKLLSAKDCIDDVLKKYPFTSDQERALVHLNKFSDFKFNLAPIFIESLLSHLINNALRAIHKANQGEVSIRTEEENNYNVIYFKDTAVGMKEDVRAHVFDRFFSKRNDQTVPGLGFCRLALLQRDGDILCHAEEGKYTEFVIKFPKETKAS